jgi:hypothetical protein
MDRLERYLRRHAKVPGWLDAYSARFVAEIARIQATHREGSVAEIGVPPNKIYLTREAYQGLYVAELRATLREG